MSRFRRPLAALLFVCCTVGKAHGVQPHRSEHAVVAVMVGNHAECTGLYIGATTVMTAAHCVTKPIDAMSVRFGKDPQKPEESVLLQGITLHPDWDPLLRTHDIAIVQLASQPTSTVPFDEPFAVDSVDAAVRFVGFGHLTADAHDAHTLDWARATVAEVTTQTVKLVSSPTTALPCFGDSGGPVFGDSDDGQLIGIVINGDALCSQRATVWRLGQPTAAWAGIRLAKTNKVVDAVDADSCAAARPSNRNHVTLWILLFAVCIVRAQSPCVLGRRR